MEGDDEFGVLHFDLRSKTSFPGDRAREKERTSIEESANGHGVSGQLRSEILNKVLVSGLGPSTLLKRLRGHMMSKLVEFRVREPKLTSQQQQHLVIRSIRRSQMYFTVANILSSIRVC